MIRIRRADFHEDHDALRAVRFAVFVDEQNVPAEIEIDDRDPVCAHVLALDERDMPVGTGRIDLEKRGKIGRVAVLASYRRAGIGAALMEALHEVARYNALASVWCNAQVSAVPFYESLGYRAVGETFVEADIDHVRMHRVL
jgi:predicted GNAT family N-acyltransferase